MKETVMKICRVSLGIGSTLLSAYITHESDYGGLNDMSTWLGGAFLFLAVHFVLIVMWIVSLIRQRKRER